MTHTDGRDLTVLLLAHGSTANDGSEAAPLAVAAQVSARRRFAAVLPCFWKQEPRLSEVLEAAPTPYVAVVPFFTGPGYFVDEVIPRALELPSVPPLPSGMRLRRSSSRTLCYTPAVGSHPTVTGLLLDRAREVVRLHPFPRGPAPEETSLIVAGHGTGRSDRSRVAVEEQVRRIRERHLYREVLPAFMEDSPPIAGCAARAASRNVVVVPFFMSDGLHVLEDIPVLLGEDAGQVRARLRAGRPPWRNPTQREARRVWYATSLGAASRLADIVEELGLAALEAMTRT